jgi:hypothetical protein
MKTQTVKAAFSWIAPGDLFFISPPPGSSEEICQKIEEDVYSFLQSNPGLEALEDYFNISGAVSFFLEGKYLAGPSGIGCDDQPGIGNYELSVEIAGNLRSDRSHGEINRWCSAELWDEIYAYGDLSGNPDRFKIKVRPT